VLISQMRNIVIREGKNPRDKHSINMKRNMVKIFRFPGRGDEIGKGNQTKTKIKNGPFTCAKGKRGEVTKNGLVI